MRDVPSLFDLDYQQAARVCADEAMKKANRGKDKQSWQYKEGFQAYLDGKPMRHGFKACYYPESRVVWRLGWLTAMFIDLNGRDMIITRRE